MGDAPFLLFWGENTQCRGLSAGPLTARAIHRLPNLYAKYTASAPPVNMCRDSVGGSTRPDEGPSNPLTDPGSPACEPAARRVQTGFPPGSPPAPPRYPKALHALRSIRSGRGTRFES